MNNGINGVNHAVGSSRFEITDLAAHNTGLVGYDEQIQIDGAERNFAHYLVTARLTGRQTPLHLDPEEWEQVTAPETDADAEVIELRAQRTADEDNQWFVGQLMTELISDDRGVAETAERMLSPWLPAGHNSVSAIVAAAKAAKELGMDFGSWPMRLKASDVVAMAGELQEEVERQREIKAQTRKVKAGIKRQRKAAPTPASVPTAVTGIPQIQMTVPTSARKVEEVERDALGRVRMSNGDWMWECAGKRRNHACGARGPGHLLVVDASWMQDRKGDPIAPTNLHRAIRCPACQAAITRSVTKREGEAIVWKQVGVALTDLEAVEARLRHNNTLYGVDGVEGSVRPSRLMVELPEELSQLLDARRWDWNAIREAGLGSPELMREVVATRRMASSQRPGPRWVRMLWFLERQFEQAQRTQDFRSRETQRKGRARQRAHQR